MTEYELKFVQKSLEIHGEKFDYSLLKISHSKDMILLTCKKHEQVFTIRADNHLSKTCVGCQQCIQENKTKSSERIKERTKIKYIEKIPQLLLEKEKHEKVIKQNKVDRTFTNLQKHVVKSIKIHGDVIDFSKVYKLTRRNRFIVICKICGKEWETCYVSLFKNRTGCQNCNQNKSKGEKLVREVLEELNVKFETQKTFEDCKDKAKLRFDFYLSEYNSIIEYNGIQHYEFIKMFHRNLQTFMEYKRRDRIKEEFCNNSGITLLAIDCRIYKTKLTISESIKTFLEKIKKRS